MTIRTCGSFFTEIKWGTSSLWSWFLYWARGFRAKWPWKDASHFIQFMLPRFIRQNKFQSCRSSRRNFEFIKSRQIYSCVKSRSVYRWELFTLGVIIEINLQLNLFIYCEFLWCLIKFKDGVSKIYIMNLYIKSKKRRLSLISLENINDDQSHYNYKDHELALKLTRL